MATGPHISALQQQILARIAANKVAGDITYFQNIWDGITFNVGTCAADLVKQESDTAQALIDRDNSVTTLGTANTALYLELATYNANVTAIKALHDSIALAGGGTVQQQDELAAINAVRAYYGV